MQQKHEHELRIRHHTGRVSRWSGLCERALVLIARVVTRPFASDTHARGPMCLEKELLNEQMQAEKPKHDQVRHLDRSWRAFLSTSI